MPYKCIWIVWGLDILLIVHELTTLAEILPLAKGLLKDIEYTTHPIRLIGLSVSNQIGRASCRERVYVLV